MKKKHENELEFKSLKKIGFGNFYGEPDKRIFDEAAVRRVLRAMEEGLTEVNFSEWNQLYL